MCKVFNSLSMFFSYIFKLCTPPPTILSLFVLNIQVYRNNESVTPNPRSPLEDYSLHIIDLHSGRLCDTRSFKCDKIILSHNQGLYLYRNILAVLSVQQQTIHVFQVGHFALKNRLRR